MGRVFRRGELKQAILVVLGSLGSAHGYAIMGELAARVGGGWRPSPGAIYPALLALVDHGYVATVDQDGSRVYSLTPEGQREVRSNAVAGRWASLGARAEASDERVTVGSLLDGFAATSASRRRLPTARQRDEINSILMQANAEIEAILDKGESNG